MKIKGKQIKNDTIQQGNFNVSTNSITDNNHITNKDFVITKINNSMGTIYQSKLNLDMTANVATVGEKATSKHVYEFPISNVMVKINNIYVNVGETNDCYFSPDGNTIRQGGAAQKGDYLYWNSTKYDLESDDEVDFVFMVNHDYYTLSANTSVELEPESESLVVEYEGAEGTTMTVTIDNTDFIVGNSGGSFVWDIGGSNEHVFTSENESIEQVVNGEIYTIWFDGFGSLIFSLKKGEKESLKENWDLDSYSYTISFNNLQGSNSTGMYFKPDGTKLYICDRDLNYIYEYNLSTAWDVSTIVYTFNKLSTQYSPNGVFFKPDGTKMYEASKDLSNQYGDAKFYQYTLSTPWDLSTASYDNVSANTGDFLPQDVFISNDGTKIYDCGNYTYSIYQATLSTPWDLSTLSQDKSINSQDSVPNGLFFKSDGTKMYEIGSSADKIYEYDLSTPWEIDTAVFVKSISTQDSRPESIYFEGNGDYMYELGSNQNKIYQYTV